MRNIGEGGGDLGVGDASLSGRHHSGSGCVSSPTNSEPFVQYSELFIQNCPYFPLTEADGVVAC